MDISFKFKTLTQEQPGLLSMARTLECLGNFKQLYLDLSLEETTCSVFSPTTSMAKDIGQSMSNTTAVSRLLWPQLLQD